MQPAQLSLLPDLVPAPPPVVLSQLPPAQVTAAWLARKDFRDRFMHLGTGPGGAELASIDWPAAITALDEGSLPCSGGEERILRLGASLGDGLPVNLRDATTGIDTRNAGLLSQAVLHANGQRPAARPR